MTRQGLKEIIDFTVNSVPVVAEVPHPSGGTVFVRMSREDEIPALHQLTVEQIGDRVAPLEAMQDVYRRNPELLFPIFRSKTGDQAQAALVGYYGFLHLNPAGAEALERGPCGRARRTCACSRRRASARRSSM